MIDKKMSDEQLIKALEICTDKLTIMCPDDCPFYDACETDLCALERQALDLIKRQNKKIDGLQKANQESFVAIEKRKGEIERLNAKSERLKEELDGETVKNMRLGHEVERLNKLVAEKQTIIGELSALITDTCEDCKVKLDADKTKSEAYKEFAEKLKGKAMQTYDWNEYIEVEDIDNTLTELTEGGNEDGMD